MEVKEFIDKASVPKCPVCGINGATKPFTGNDEDWGYCWQHMPTSPYNREKANLTNPK